jgi:hypothetical protein
MKKSVILIMAVFAFGQKSYSQILNSDRIELMLQDKHSPIYDIIKYPSDTIYKYLSKEEILRDQKIKVLDSIIENIQEIKLGGIQNMEELNPLWNQNNLINNLNPQYKNYITGKDLENISNSNSSSHLNKHQFQAIGDINLKKNINSLSTLLLLDNYVLDPNLIIMKLSLLRSHKTIQMLYNVNLSSLNQDTIKIPEAMHQRNLDLIRARLEVVESKNYVLYQSYIAKNKAIKSVEFFMDNDFFLFNGHNADREYTGGGALSFSTDYLKWRWLKLEWLLKLCKRSKDNIELSENYNSMMLSYQSIKLGMHFYTPYIRYRQNFDLADSLYQNDRPFGSYIYLERSKYRLWPSGLVRNQGSFQIGQIGTNAGNEIQAMLHKDIITTSQKVYGWENQIANGGRWTVQFNQKIDLMLFSSINKYTSIFRPKKINNKFTTYKNSNEVHNPNMQYLGINIFNSTELFFGGYYTAVGSGIVISGLDFTRQSGQNLIASKRKNIYEFGFNWELGIKYRYIIHNTMLEGFGLFSTYADDPYDDESPTTYSLSPEQINRHVLIGDLKLNFKWRKMTFFYSFSIITKEYKMNEIDYNGLTNLVNPEDLEFYTNEVIPGRSEFNSNISYGYGRVGLVWIVN